MKKTHYYESHLGGLYTDTEERDFDDLYCDECGDSDTYLGYFTPEELIEYLLDDDNFSGGIDYPTGHGGWCIDEIARVTDLTEKQVLDYCKKHTEVKKIKDLTKEERDLICNCTKAFLDKKYIKDNYMYDCTKCKYGCELNQKWIKNQKDRDFYNNSVVRLDSYKRQWKNIQKELKREKKRKKR